MSVDALELFALGLRIGSKASAILTDDLFNDGTIHRLVDGDSAARTLSLAEWLKSMRVTWDGTQETLIQSVADALRLRNELVAARKMLSMATLQLKYSNLTEPSVLADVLRSLREVQNVVESK